MAGTTSSSTLSVQEQIDLYNKQLAFLNTGSDADYGNLNEIEDLGLVYGEFGTAWGTALLDYVKETNPKSVTLYVGVGGGPTRYHNMHAGCLTGEYFTNGSNTFRILNQLRRHIYQVEAKSKTSTSNLVDLLTAMAKPQEFSLGVNASRMWFINDITYGTGEQGSCDKALFWGNLTSVTTSTTGVPNATVTLRVIDVYEKFNDVAGLTNTFLQTITPANSVKKWDDNKKEWYLNSYAGSGSYKILSVTASGLDSFILTLSGSVPTSVTANVSDLWWISFDKKYEISGGYNYITAPYVAMDGALGKGKGRNYESVILNGLYVGLPLKEPLTENSVFSLILENGGIYPNPTLPPTIYMSTARKGSTFGFSRNPFNGKEFLLYMKKEDEGMALFVRYGSMNFMQNLGEVLVYYGDPNYKDVTVSGSAGATQEISMGNDVDENYVVGFTFKRDGSIATPVNGAYPFTIWEVWQGNYLIGYTSTSNLVSTIYTRRADGKYLTEVKNYVADYKPATILSSDKIKYLISAGMENSEIIGKSTLKLVPVYNNASACKIKEVKIGFVSRINVVRNVNNPYIYALKNSFSNFLFVKKQSWVREEDGSSNITISSTAGTPVRTGTLTNPRIFRPQSIDPNQDGVFLLSTTDEFESYCSGTFTRTSGWSESTDPGQKITSIPDSSLTESNLYKIPFLLVPNITRCVYSGNDTLLDIVGFSNLKETETTTNFTSLSLVHCRCNLYDLFAYPIYIVKSTTGKYLFSYCNSPTRVKRIIVEKAAYMEDSLDTPVFTDSSLAKGAITVATINNIIVIVTQQLNGIVCLISMNGGNDWSYLDDIPLTSGNTSSPSIKIYDNIIWLMYVENTTDLYLKKIPLGLFASLASGCINSKSSLQQGSSFIILKNNVKSYLNTKYVPVFVTQINDQQVVFEKGNESWLHVIYQDTEGAFKAIGSNDQGRTWDYAPINF